MQNFPGNPNFNPHPQDNNNRHPYSMFRNQQQPPYPQQQQQQLQQQRYPGNIGGGGGGSGIHNSPPPGHNRTGSRQMQPTDSVISQIFTESDLDSKYIYIYYFMIIELTKKKQKNL